MKTNQNATFKTMDVIVSTSCEFNSDADVAEYNALDEIEVPEDDMHWRTCTKIVMGYARIFLYFTDSPMVVYDRRTVRGLAIDGHAIPVHGPKFQRIDTDGYEFPAPSFEATEANDSADEAEAEDPVPDPVMVLSDPEDTTEATVGTEE